MSEGVEEPILGSEPHTSGLERQREGGQPTEVDAADNKGLRGPRNLPEAMIKALRPKQWVKNALVVAAPAAAGGEMLFQERVLLDILIAFVVFCLAASSIYLINDARDVEADRAHPTKRFRPIAAGVLPVSLAYVMAVVLIAAAVGGSFLASSGPGLALSLIHI